MCEPHRLLYAPHFGKLSEFDKVLSFGASRTGFYATHTLANFQSLPKLIIINPPAGASLQLVPNSKFSPLLLVPFVSPVSPVPSIQNSEFKILFFPHPQFKIQNSKFKILKVLKTVLISIFVIRRCYSFIP